MLDGRIDDHELASDPPGLAEKAHPRFLLEVSVEVSGEEPVERPVVEGQLQRVGNEELTLGDALLGNRQHPLARVDADDLALEGGA